MSRIAILERLIAFAMQLLDGVRRLDVGAFVRIARWLRIAVALSFHIDHGALDEPRKARKARTRQPDSDTDADAGAETQEAAERPDGEPSHKRERDYEDEEVRAYLGRPFGEVVALICRGLGMTPDWEAWACEAWAQEEIRTQPPGSPYTRQSGIPLSAPPAVGPPDPSPRPRHDLHAIRPAAPPGLPAPPPNRKARRVEAGRARQRSAKRRASAAGAAI